MAAALELLLRAPPLLLPPMTAIQKTTYKDEITLKRLV